MTREEAKFKIEDLISDAEGEGAPDWYIAGCKKALEVLWSPSTALGWMPIESALKDGAAVDLLCLSKFYTAKGDPIYTRLTDCIYFDEAWGQIDADEEFHAIQFEPIYWMIFPPPPQPNGSNEQPQPQPGGCEGQAEIYKDGFRSGILYAIGGDYCRCSKEYKERKLVDPSCFYHQIIPQYLSIDGVVDMECEPHTTPGEAD